MAIEDDNPSPSDSESRPPTPADLRDLCRELNQRGARYIVVGGFAIIAAGFNRQTMDVDLLIDTAGNNEKVVLDAVSTLPDQAAKLIKPGEILQYGVVRIADEIVVDLMRSACSIDFEKARERVVFKEIDGVNVPFASPELLWLMKKPTHREKDIPDLIFLRELFHRRGVQPPSCD